MVTEVNPLEKHISEAEKLLNRYELKLNEYNGTASKIPTDFVPLSEVTLADEAWHSKMTEGKMKWSRKGEIFMHRIKRIWYSEILQVEAYISNPST